MLDYRSKLAPVCKFFYELLFVAGVVGLILAMVYAPERTGECVTIASKFEIMCR